MAKRDTRKLPKKIAGVKVPKFLRQPGTITDFLNSPVGRLVLAEALLAAAAALKNYKPVAETVGHATESLFECAISMTYADSAVSAPSLEHALGLQDRLPSACPIRVDWVPTATAARSSGANY